MEHRKKPARSQRKASLSRPPRSAPQAPPILAEDAADAAIEAAIDAQAGSAESGEPRLVRLNKYLADHGVASRRRCDELIAAGQVSVDGEHVTELGLKVDPERTVIEVNGVVLKPKDARRRYYVLNKPAGVVCTNEPRETRPRAVDLITDPYKGRIYTVGRLDEESKGLILLTNDGDFANRIMHPRYGIEKTYTVRVAGRIDDESLQKIREGVHLSEGRTAGARILVDRRTADASQLTVTIHEGMNREIRRAFARVGYKVTDLRRVRIGPLTDRGVKPGRWRELLNREVDALLAGKNESEDGGRGFEGGSPKRFPKKRGYARNLVKGGKLVPGARREREERPKPGARGTTRAGGGPRREGAKQRGSSPPPWIPRDRGARGSGPRKDRPHDGGAAPFAGRGTGARDDRARSRSGPSRPGARSPASRGAGPRGPGPRGSGPQRSGSGGSGPRGPGPRGAGSRGPSARSPGGRGPGGRGPGAPDPRAGRGNRR